MADYFISYTSSERDWAHRVHRELERLDHKPRLHEREIKPGEGISAWMLNGFSEERARLCREFLTATASPEPILRGRTIAANSVPIRVPKPFLGREVSLQAVAAAQARYENRAAITALHGLRGVGETAFAAADGFVLCRQGALPSMERLGLSTCAPSRSTKKALNPNNVDTATRLNLRSR